MTTGYAAISFFIEKCLSADITKTEKVTIRCAKNQFVTFEASSFLLGLAK